MSAMFRWSSGFRGPSVACGSQATDAVLGSLSAEFDVLYADSGRPSIAPEVHSAALVVAVFYSVRSERLLVEQIDYNLLFRWFVGPGHGRCDVEPRGVFQERDRF